jgi:hypothetical protein
LTYDAERGSELRLKHGLTDVRLKASVLVARAVVVDLALLLQFAHQAAATMAASDQTGESKVVLLLLPASAKSLLYELLDPVPQFSRNYRLLEDNDFLSGVHIASLGPGVVASPELEVGGSGLNAVDVSLIQYELLGVTTFKCPDSLGYQKTIVLSIPCAIFFFVRYDAPKGHYSSLFVAPFQLRRSQ